MAESRNDSNNDSKVDAWAAVALLAMAVSAAIYWLSTL